MLFVCISDMSIVSSSEILTGTWTQQINQNSNSQYYGMYSTGNTYLAIVTILQYTELYLMFYSIDFRLD